MREILTRKSLWRKSSRIAALLLPLLLNTAAANAVAQDKPAMNRIDAPTENYQPALLDVEVNRQESAGTLLVYRSPSGEPMLSADDLKHLRLRVPAIAPVVLRGLPYYPVSALPGATYAIDETAQSLSLQVSAQGFVMTQTSADHFGTALPAPPSPGIFFNYDVSVEHSTGADIQSGLFEVGAFNRLGVATINFQLQRGAATPHAVRFDSTFTADRPADLASLRIGDAVTRSASLWGQPIRFGGLQYATNFATQPGFVTLPLQNFVGQTALPSIVDVYVNNVLATHKDVPPGPFSISALPVVTGQGEVQLVVQDVLGRTQVISQPYYAGPSLLRPGLNDFSVELGAIRQKYGLASFNYGPVFASGTYRQGINNAVTGEGHVEVQANGQAGASLGAAVLLPWVGVLSASAAASHSHAGTGHLWALALDRQSRLFSFGVRTQQADERFRQLGSEPDFPPPLRQTSANLAVATGRYGSLGLTYVSQTVPAIPGISLVSLSYSVQLNRVGLMSITSFRTVSGPPRRSIAVSLTLPLEGRTPNVSLTHVSSQGAADQSLLEAQRNLPAGDGYGYRLQAAVNAPQQVSLNLQNRIARYTFDAAQFLGQTALRAEFAGGGAVLDGHTFLSRSIDGSFGLLQLPGLPDVRVYVDNHLVARTDSDGNALVPRLRAYDNNPVRVEQADLPWDAEIGSLSVNAVPSYRSGVLIRPPITRTVSAMMRIVTPDGKPLPAGTEVEIEGQPGTFPVAMDGALYLTGLGSSNHLRVRSNGMGCEATVTFRQSTDPLPNLGNIICSWGRP